MSWRFVIHDREDRYSIVDDMGNIQWEGGICAALELLAKTLEVCHDVADSSWLINAARTTLTFLDAQKEAAEAVLSESMQREPD